MSEFGDKYVFRWTGLDDLSAEQAWVEEQALSTLNEARKARGQEALDWGDCPLNNVTMGAYMQGQQASMEDYGNPDAPASDEIVVALGAATGGRVHPRIGNRYLDIQAIEAERAAQG